MNAQVPAAVRPQLHTGGQVAALVPQTLEEAFRVANAFAVSGLAPQSLKTAEAILVAIMAGAELGFAPYQAMQSFAVINGRASIWGDAIPALLWSRGFDIEEWFDDDDNATKAFCKVTRPGGKIIERTFSLKDAKLASLLGKQGPWQTAQKRMLQMRARAFAARDGAADVLRGMPVYEEVADFQEIREVRSGPAPTGMRARLEARQGGGQGFDADHIARETGATPAQDQNDDAPSVDAEFEDAPKEEEGDSFPGDQAQQPVARKVDGVNTASQVLTTVKSRKEAFEAHAKKAPTAAALKTLRDGRHFDALCNDIDAGDPDEVGTGHELRTWLESLIERHEDEERDAEAGA